MALFQRVPRSVASAKGPARLAVLFLGGSACRAFGLGSHVSNNNPDVLQKAKDEQVEAAKKLDEGDGTVLAWSEVLASDSEATVRARGETRRDRPSTEWRARGKDGGT